jgi:hypothetical protein
MPCLQIDEAEAKRVAADGAERTHLSEGEVSGDGQCCA